MGKTAVVGLGYWGPNLLRNLCKLRDVSDVIACDRSPERLAHVRQNFPQIALTDSFDEVLERSDVESVVFATPVSTHYPLAKAALMAGKHVLVEKPLADGIGWAEELIEIAQEKGVVLMTGHTFLFSPPVVAVKEMIDAGVIGDIHYIQSSRVNLGIHQADSSVIWDLAPHDFSIIFWWLGETPTGVSACAQDSLRRGVPDVAFVDLQFGSGRMANCHLSWLAPTKMRRMTIVGSKRMVLYEDTNLEEPIKVYDKGINLEPHEDYGQYRLTYRTGEIVSPRIGSSEPLHQEVAHFLECVATGSAPRGGADLPVSIVRAIEAAEASCGRGGHMVDPDLVRRYPRREEGSAPQASRVGGELILAAPALTPSR